MSEGATFVLPTATVAFLEAERLAHEGLALTAEQGILLETFEQLEVLAQVAAATGAPEEAARITGAVRAIRTRHRITTRPPRRHRAP